MSGEMPLLSSKLPSYMPLIRLSSSCITSRNQTHSCRQLSTVNRHLSNAHEGKQLGDIPYPTTSPLLSVLRGRVRGWLSADEVEALINLAAIGIEQS